MSAVVEPEAPLGPCLLCGALATEEREGHGDIRPVCDDCAGIGDRDFEEAAFLALNGGPMDEIIGKPAPDPAWGAARKPRRKPRPYDPVKASKHREARAEATRVERQQRQERIMAALVDFFRDLGSFQ